MKKYLAICLGLVLLFAGCSYDDGELWNKVNDIDSRLTKVEEALSQMNSNITTMQTVVNALQNNLYITNVTQNADGYTVTFSDNRTVTIKNGKDGDVPFIGNNGNWWIGSTDTGVSAGQAPFIGTNGNWWIGNTDLGVRAIGQDGVTPHIGTNGNWWIGTTDTGVKAVGQDGLTPFIGANGNWWIGNTDTGVKANGEGGSTTSVPIIGIDIYNGVYYWTQTVNGTTTWLLDKDGNKLPVNAYSPIFKVDIYGYFVYSIDGGMTWIYIFDNNNNPVYANGGCDCVDFFQNVYVSGDYLYLVLIDGTVVKIRIGEGGNHDVRLDVVVPPEIQEKIKDYMPLYEGVNPPVLDDAYYIDPFVAVYCEDQGNGGFDPGTQVASKTIKFSNFNSANNTLDYAGYTSTSTEKGDGAFICGSGNNFTAFFNTEGQTNSIYTKTALVISGTKTSTGIKDLYYAFIMVEKGADPNNYLMKEGIFRIFKDQDGLSVLTTWNGNAKVFGAEAPTFEWSVFSNYTAK